MGDGKGRGRVLVVDDSGDVRAVIRTVLEDEGFDVIDEAGTGREGVALATLHQPDVVVVDVMMPDMDGITAVPLLREAHPEMKVVVFSSRSLSETERAAMAAGADAYVEKVHIVPGLVDALDALLGPSG